MLQDLKPRHPLSLQAIKMETKHLQDLHNQETEEIPIVRKIVPLPCVSVYDCHRVNQAIINSQFLKVFGLIDSSMLVQIEHMMPHPYYPDIILIKKKGEEGYYQLPGYSSFTFSLYSRL